MRVYLRTFGCRANHYDSETARAMIESSGHVCVGRAEDADVAVFNSCAVTAEAEADLRKAVRRAAREQPALRSVIMGCASGLPDGEGPRSLRALPTVEQLIAGADMPALAEALSLPASSSVARATLQSTTRALLRIQDGCDEHCTFCATTLARGENRSRAADELVAEATRLAEIHPEIVLTGVHIGSYGRDTGSSLGELLARLVREVPLVRFRLSSLEATEIDDRLVDLLTGDATRVAPYLHAPLQSGSDGVLKRMGRYWYTAEGYARAVERLAGAQSTFGLGADLIAGFPGELEADHQRTLALVERLPFTYLHVFPFSLRPGTAAERLPARVSPETADHRARELRALAATKAADYCASRAGGSADVIVVGGAGTAREGITEDYLSVALSDPTLGRGVRFSARLSWNAGRLTAIRNSVAPADVS